MTTVRVLAGERTIGGTMIVVEDAVAQLVFDCGLAYSPSTYPFAHVEERPGLVLSDLIALGMAPDIPGLWNPGFTSTWSADGAGRHSGDPLRERGHRNEGAGPPASGRSNEVAVAISHSHLDHTFFVNYVDPAIPVYSSPPTARIVRVLREQGQLAGPERPITAVEPGDEFWVGSIRVRMMPVDHDLPGACGLLIETRDGKIAYSGDFRLHGRHPDLSLAFADSVRQAGVGLLILEGTGVRPPPAEPLEGEVWVERGELEVVSAIIEALRPVPDRLSIVLLTPENAERVEELARALEAEGRMLAIDATMLELAQAGLGRDLDARYGVYVRADGRDALLPNRISDSEIVAAPGSFLLAIPFRRFAELIDLVPERNGGLIIASNAVPLGTFDPAWTHLEWWAKMFGFELRRIGSTGHAYPADLAHFAERTGARRIMAIHSHFPELMPIEPEKLLLPVRGRKYELVEIAR